MTLSPLPTAKRKRRFAKIDEEYIEDEDDHDEDEDESGESNAPETAPLTAHEDEAAK
jgi:hypothetical protein